ncbi:MAG: lysophospholipid acyltransferase family protein [Methylobacter sp.]
MFAIGSFLKKQSWRLFGEPLAARLLDFYFFRLLQGRIVGAHHLTGRPCILAFNHSSYLDWLLVYHLFKRHYRTPVFFLAKAKLNGHPLSRACIRLGQAIVVDYEQKQSIRKALNDMREHLNAGHTVGIFPEGTRSSDGRLQNPQEGVAWLAIQAGVPIVPVALQGFYDAWPRHRRLPGIARCTIRIGEPLLEAEHIDRRRFTEKLMGRLAQLLTEIG